MPLSSSGPQNMVKPGIRFSIDSIVGSNVNNKEPSRPNSNSRDSPIINNNNNNNNNNDHSPVNGNTNLIGRSIHDDCSKDNRSSTPISKDNSDMVTEIVDRVNHHINDDPKSPINSISPNSASAAAAAAAAAAAVSNLSPYTSLAYGNNLLKAQQQAQQQHQHQQQQQQQQQQAQQQHHLEANNHHHRLTAGLTSLVDRSGREQLRYPYPIEPALFNLNPNYASTLNGLFNGHFNGPRAAGVPTHYPHPNHQLIRFMSHPFHPIPNPFFTPYFRKPKRVRTAFSPSQLMELERAFDKNNYVIGNERKELAKKLGLNETQVKVWFQNRRTKQKRQKQEEDDGTYQVSNSGKRNEADESECMSEVDDEEDAEITSEISNGYRSSSPKLSANDPHR